MKVLTHNMIGRYFPFFLNNKKLGSSYYIYQLVSPGMSPNGFPLITLKKVSERTLQENSEPQGRGNDLVVMASGIQKPNKNTGKVLDWLRKGYDEFPEYINFKGDEFPEFEMDPYNQNTQRNLVVLLRDAIRWNKQRFFDDRLIDVLWDSKHIITCQVKAKDGSVSLVPQAMYDILDTNLKNPLSLPSLKTIPDILKGKVFKDIGGGKCPGLCIALKRLEWESFDRGRKEKPMPKHESTIEK